MNPNKEMADWPPSSAAQRTADCLTFLSVHNFITDGEKQKVIDRIRKWVKDHEKKTVKVD